MSFTKNDRNFRQKTGKTFPKDGRYSGFVEAISTALLSEFGASPSSVKKVARLTSANERSVRNWFDGKNGPSGEHLIRLMRSSDAVATTVLGLTGRSGPSEASELNSIRDQLLAIVATLDRRRGDQSPADLPRPK